MLRRVVGGAVSLSVTGLLLRHGSSSANGQTTSCAAAKGGRKGVAVVTGGSRGIGAATCKLLASEGYRVAVNYRTDGAAAAHVVAEIEAAGGVAAAIRADVAVEADVARLFEETEARLGTPLVALVNNAGITTSPPRGPTTTLEGLRTEELARVLQTNVVGALLCCREASARMGAAGGGGAIVNVSSGSAYLGGNLAYAVSKGAMNSLQCALVAPLMARGIRINTVSPGMCETDMTAELVKAVDTRTATPAGRVGQPREVAHAIAWLLDAVKASYTAGANIRVAGGKQTGFGQ